MTHVPYNGAALAVADLIAGHGPVTSTIFFFNETPTTEIYTLLYTLSLHDALPISTSPSWRGLRQRRLPRAALLPSRGSRDRKSTRLNSSHTATSRMPSSA